jgi:hypothetical protein
MTLDEANFWCEVEHTKQTARKVIINFLETGECESLVPSAMLMLNEELIAWARSGL